MLQYLAQRPVAEQYEFLCGIPEGFATLINLDGEFAGKRQRYEIYLLLLMTYELAGNCRNANGAATQDAS